MINTESTTNVCSDRTRKPFFFPSVFSQSVIHNDHNECCAFMSISHFNVFYVKYLYIDVFFFTSTKQQMCFDLIRRYGKIAYNPQDQSVGLDHKRPTCRTAVDTPLRAAPPLSSDNVAHTRTQQKYRFADRQSRGYQNVQYEMKTFLIKSVGESHEMQILIPNPSRLIPLYTL